MRNPAFALFPRRSGDKSKVSCGDRTGYEAVVSLEVDAVLPYNLSCTVDAGSEGVLRTRIAKAQIFPVHKYEGNKVGRSRIETYDDALIIDAQRHGGIVRARNTN